MIVIGLTGSIGMGKSATSAMLREAGLPVYDADAAVHKLYAGAAVAPVRAAFPDAVIDGRVDRVKLSRMVLGDSTTLRRLEEIVHPLVGADRTSFLEKCIEHRAAACVLDVPLLFETAGDPAVDVVVVVSADAAEQERRVLARSDMTREKFMAIRNKQIPDVEKRRRAHYVIDSSHGFDLAKRQVARLLLALGI